MSRVIDSSHPITGLKSHVSKQDWFWEFLRRTLNIYISAAERCDKPCWIRNEFIYDKSNQCRRLSVLTAVSKHLTFLLHCDALKTVLRITQIIFHWKEFFTEKRIVMIRCELLVLQPGTFFHSKGYRIFYVENFAFAVHKQTLPTASTNGRQVRPIVAGECATAILRRTPQGWQLVSG